MSNSSNSTASSAPSSADVKVAVSTATTIVISVVVVVVLSLCLLGCLFAFYMIKRSKDKPPHPPPFHQPEFYLPQTLPPIPPVTPVLPTAPLPKYENPARTVDGVYTPLSGGSQETQPSYDSPQSYVHDYNYYVTDHVNLNNILNA
jgi:hypothetical protein